MTDLLTLTVQTPVNGYEVEFTPDHHVQAVIGEVLSREGALLGPSYGLVTDDGEPFPFQTTLGEMGVEDGDVLILDVYPAGEI